MDVPTIPSRSLKRTYSSVGNVASVASATDIFLINGVAGKPISVTRVEVTGVHTTAGLVDVSLVRRSTANSGGTSAATTIVPHDSSSPAAGAVMLQYTANPTPGTLVGAIKRAYTPVGPAATSIALPSFTFEAGLNGQPIRLNGVAEGLAVNLGGVTVTGGSFTCRIEWVEEVN